MQIGQILVEQRLVEPIALTRALAEQRHTGKRICSLLIARGLLDPDDAVRALAGQHGVPGVLQRHLENRDRGLAQLLPAQLARAVHALPIGRTRNHELIVCVRDPAPGLCQTIAAAIGGPVVIVVAPASQLEQLITDSYRAPYRAPRAQPSIAPGPALPASDEVSFDVDLSTRPIATVRDSAIAAYTRRGEPGARADSAAAGAPAGAVEVEVEPGGVPVLGDLGSMTLVELDDDRVARDPTQGSQLAMMSARSAALPPRPTTPPLRPTMPPPRSSPPPRAAGNPSALRTTGSPVLPAFARSEIEAALTAIARAASPAAACEAAMDHVARRFRHAVLFAIHGGVALGDRGHGGQLTDELVHAIAIPLSAPSIVQAAHDTRRPVTAAPPGAGVIQDRLVRALGSPQAFAALPIEVGARVAYVVAVGDSSGGPTAAPAALRELERLAGALGAACQRLAAP